MTDSKRKAVLAERERCARICETMAVIVSHTLTGTKAAQEKAAACRETALSCAKVIRMESGK